MKKKVCLLLAVALLLSGCAAPAGSNTQNRYETSFLGFFDTVTTLVGYAESEAAFQQAAQRIQNELERYHQLFDIYNEYPGVTNLKVVNDRAGQEPVTVDQAIIDLLVFCQEMEQATGGMVNVAMGSVLRLWHEARNAGMENPDAAQLPGLEALQAASAHSDLADVILDEAACTVQFADPELKLDVGAVAKGYAVEMVCRTAPAGMLLSVGGNVCSTGPKPDGSSWVVGLQKPDGDGYLHTVYADRTAVVTSGDYQRYYVVDGVRYHHIIDPETQMPADKWQAVSVVCRDSAVGDALSTALFLLDQQAGQALLDQFDAEAMWLDKDGNEYFSPGFAEHLRS